VLRRSIKGFTSKRLVVLIDFSEKSLGRLLIENVESVLFLLYMWEEAELIHKTFFTKFGKK